MAEGIHWSRWVLFLLILSLVILVVVTQRDAIREYISPETTPEPETLTDRVRSLASNVYGQIALGSMGVGILALMAVTYLRLNPSSRLSRVKDIEMETKAKRDVAKEKIRDIKEKMEADLGTAKNKKRAEVYKKRMQLEMDSLARATDEIKTETGYFIKEYKNTTGDIFKAREKLKKINEQAINEPLE